MRSADCLAHRSWRADVGIGPYEKTGSGSVGADFISARAPPRRMHLRRTHPYGEGNHRTPVRIIARFRAAIKAAPTAGMGDGAFGGLPCTQKRAGRCGHRPLREDRERVCRGGFYIRPRTAASDAPSPNAPLRREGIPGVIIARFRASHKGRPYGGDGRRCGSADCLARRSGRADVGIGPYEENRRSPAGTTCFRAAFFCTSFRAASILRQPHFSPSFP